MFEATVSNMDKIDIFKYSMEVKHNDINKAKILYDEILNVINSPEIQKENKMQDYIVEFTPEETATTGSKFDTETLFSQKVTALNFAIDATRIGSIHAMKAEDIVEIAKVFEEFLKV